MKPWLCYLISCGLVGCVNLVNPPVHYPPALPVNQVPPPKVHGTIYQAGYEMHLYEDKVARKIGDVLTVRLEEANKGEYKANTNTDKKASLNYPVPTVFGQVVPAMAIQTNTEQKFDGAGNSDQSDKLTGRMSVTVMNVLPNGDLAVQGETWLTINQGQKYIQLTGIVRQQDIEPDNVVSSNRIASAQITYGARGQAGYASNGGLITKLFNRFYPY